MKRVLLLVALACVSCTANAAENLGRLFYTPSQRAKLDALRAQRHVAPPPAEVEQPAPVPEVLTYDGVVRRSDGKTTLWINDRAILDGNTAGKLPVPARVRPDHRVTFTLPNTGKSVELRVGERVEVVSGTVQEPYAEGDARAAHSEDAPDTPPSSSATRTGDTARGAHSDERVRR